MTGDLVDLTALGPDGEYRTRNREIIEDTAGVPVAETSLVPRLFVQRSIDAQRKLLPLAAADREAALTRAADVFASSTIAGLDFDSYVELTCRVTGLPMTTARAGAHAVAESLTTACDAVRPARPVGASSDWRDLSMSGGGAVWARRGEVLAVQLPATLLACTASGRRRWRWATGWRSVRRGASRSPPTGSSTPCGRTAFVLATCYTCQPTTPSPTMSSGRSTWPWSTAVRTSSTSTPRNPRVLTNGPGRTKILITAECDWRDYLDVIVDSIANLGGMACVNATAVLYEGDAAPLAHAIAERLSTIAPLSNTDERAILPTTSIEAAQALADHLAARAAGTVAVLGAGQVVADLGGGFAALRPAVHLLATPDPAKLNVELPFPCAWVSPWSREDGIAPLRNSLVLNVITTDDQLVDELVGERTVTNVYRGRHATHHTAPHIPHEGFLADFLMRNKGFIGD